MPLHTAKWPLRERGCWLRSKPLPPASIGAIMGYSLCMCCQKGIIGPPRAPTPMVLGTWLWSRRRVGVLAHIPYGLSEIGELSRSGMGCAGLQGDLYPNDESGAQVDGHLGDLTALLGHIANRFDA